MSVAQYDRVIKEGAQLGCQNIQFIGGEPTLNKALPHFINTASIAGYQFIEVFSNLVSLDSELLRTFKSFGVALATSFYSADPAVHDRITTRPGSWHRTVKNIKRVLSYGIRIRVGVITMEENSSDYQQTYDFLTELGVEAIGTDRIRSVGRGGSNHCELGELCGSCSGNILSIGPDGVVAPCNMSRAWPVGSVLDSSLESIARSDVLRDIREAIGRESSTAIEAVCNPKTCGPYNSCCPSTQSCNPCAPSGCNPCFPNG